ncbi:paramyosin-like [Nothobranchius furzeri]|uniref:Paramyosin-like n=1 Tax=Nothobranchius furzeri TaxID=105023 RepID=A0A9D3C0S7_NOTFU|nr:paramyosin-like [Nothobranchius furzeri]
MTDESYCTEKEKRCKAENDCEKLKDFINQLEQGLDYYQNTTETCQKNVETLKEHLQESERFCEDLQRQLDHESRLRFKLEQEKKNKPNGSLCHKLRIEIHELEQGLDYYQNKVVNFEKQVQDLQNQLLEKETVCENLQLTLEQESQLRAQLEQEQKNRLDKDLVNESLNTEISVLKKLNLDLMDELDMFKSRKTEAEEKLSKELEILKLQLQEKTSLCEKLEVSFSEENRLRLNQQAELDKSRDVISQNSGFKQEILDLKQSNSELREAIDKSNSEKVESDLKLDQELQTVKKQLEKERKIRLSLESELVNSTETARLNEQLMTRLRSMEKTEMELRRVIVDLQLDQMKTNEKNKEQLETLKQQLKERISPEVQPGSEIRSQEPETSVGGLETDPDEDSQTGTEVSSPTELLEQSDSEEVSQRLHGSDSLPVEDRSPKEELPQTAERNRETISRWRRLKKFLTPACLRKHKGRS